MTVKFQELRLEEHTGSLTPVLEEFRSGHLPLLSTDFTAGSMEYRDYITLVNSFCHAASLTLSSPLIAVGAFSGILLIFYEFTRKLIEYGIIGEAEGSQISTNQN